MMFKDVVYVCAEVMSGVANEEQQRDILHKMLNAFEFVNAINSDQRRVIETAVDEFDDLEESFLCLLACA